MSNAKQFCETSSIIELDNVKNESILWDFLNFWTWQRQKRNNSARLPQFKLTTSKTKQFCETSFKNGKLSGRADGLVPIRFLMFPLHLSEVLRLLRKSDARSYQVLHLSRKITLANLRVWCSKMQTRSRIQRPNLLTSLMNMSLVQRLPREMHLPPEPQIIWKTQWIATFPPFCAPASSVFWLFLFSDLLSSALLFSDSSHLCFFSSVYIVGSLTSTLPSTNYIYRRTQILKFHAERDVGQMSANVGRNEKLWIDFGCLPTCRPW